jgi:hypothetical protein
VRAIKEFTTAAKDQGVGEAPIDFSVDGTVLKAYRPSEGQMAVFMASIGKGSNDIDMVAGPLNFFDSLLDGEGRAYFTERLLDRDDPMDIPTIVEIMESIIEDWAGRPTPEPSDSTASLQSTGSNSTAPTPTPTSSPSLLTSS